MKIYTVLSRDRGDFIYNTTCELTAGDVRDAQERDEEMAGGRPSVYIRETTLDDIKIDKFSEGYGQGLEHGDTQAKIDTPADIKEFIGEAMYDDHGQLIFRGADKDNLQQFLDVRGWGSIQNMGFKTQQDAMDFQDKVGQWVTDVINNNLK